MRTKVFFLILISLSFSLITSAEEPSINGSIQADPTFQDSKGVAIRGYDPIAYFDQEKAVKGKPEFEYRWNGATWRFASSTNRDTFAQDPQRYAPQYGGYCAYGMSSGYAAPIDPQAWSVVNGKLYLNYSLKVRHMWNRDQTGHIAKADVNWPKIPKKTIPR